jgi:hypothetical protein
MDLRRESLYLGAMIMGIGVSTLKALQLLR